MEVTSSFHSEDLRQAVQYFGSLKAGNHNLQEVVDETTPTDTAFSRARLPHSRQKLAGVKGERHTTLPC